MQTRFITKRSRFESKLMQEVQVLSHFVSVRGCSLEAYRSALQSGTQVTLSTSLDPKNIRALSARVCVSCLPTPSGFRTRLLDSVQFSDGLTCFGVLCVGVPTCFANVRLVGMRSVVAFV